MTLISGVGRRSLRPCRSRAPEAAETAVRRPPDGLRFPAAAATGSSSLRRTRSLLPRISRCAQSPSNDDDVGLRRRGRGRARAAPEPTSRDRSSSASRASARTDSAPAARSASSRTRAAEACASRVGLLAGARRARRRPCGRAPRARARIPASPSASIRVRSCVERFAARPPGAPASSRAAARSRASSRSRGAQALERLLRFGLRFLAPLPGLAQDLVRPREDGLRNALLARDGDGAAAAGEARVQPVVRPAGRLVELHRGAERVGPRGREGLDGRQVRRDQRAAARLQVRLEERDGERASLFRVRGAADLVDQGERSRPRVAQDAGERLHRGGERRAVRQDRLRVADLGPDRAEDRQPRSRGGRHGMPHWASSEKSPAVFSTTVLPPALGPDTTRSRRSAGSSKSSGTACAALARLPEDALPELLEARVEQGMARGDDRPAAVVRDLGQARLAHLAEGRLRLQRVERGELRDRRRQRLFVLQDRPAEVPQQPLDLAALLRGEEGQVVVGLDDLHRLDEDGLAGARAVVHDPGDAARAPTPAREGSTGRCAGRRRRRRPNPAARRGASPAGARPRRGAAGAAAGSPPAAGTRRP